MSVKLAIASAAHTLPQQASSALISSVWEGAVLVAATGLFLHLLPQTTARFRFMMWSTVFLLLTALPVLNVFLASHSMGAGIGTVAPVQLDPRWSYALTAIWLAAVAIRAAHLAIQAIKLRTLWKSAIPLGGESIAALGLVLHSVSGKVQICTSSQLDRPSVIGFFAPRILIPAWLFNQLTASELHQIVLHELEHLRRRDDWLNLLQKLTLVIFPLNPALLWIDRRLATERELACDDGVLERTHAPRAYATCLTSLAERRLAYRGTSRLTALALGAVGIFRRSEFSRRIESILASRTNVAAAPSSALLTLAIAGMIGFTAASARAPQLVSFSAAGSQEPAVLRSVVRPASAVSRSAAVKPVARSMNASFHVPEKADPPPSAKDDKFKKHRKTSNAKRRNAILHQTTTLSGAAATQPERQWMVLTSWHETAPSPVVVTLPDGRTFFVTYPATPTQVDWLLVQL